MLPATVKPALEEHLRRVQMLFEEDRRNELPGVELPNALERKYPNADKEWAWQWVFPARGVSRDPRSGIVRRHHVIEDGLQRAVKAAGRLAQLSKRANCHILRHSFATHVLNRGGLGVRSPMDVL